MYTIAVCVFSPGQLNDNSLVVGSAIPLTVLIELLQTHKDSSLATFSQLAEHLSKIANVPVRNVSWVTMIKTAKMFNTLGIIQL